MDVVNPPNTDVQPMRRRRDQLSDWQRSLDWSTRRGDIDLYPRSALTLADILTQPATRLNLVPDNGGEPSAKTIHRVTAQTTGKADDSQQAKAELLTRHSSDELYELCKAIQVTNALVKQRGLQGLYVVAGFLCIRDKATQRPLRAPLLLFPSVLACTPSAHDNAHERRYELNLQTHLPDENFALHELALSQWNVRIPRYEAHESLATWFSKVTAAIATIDDVNLELDVAVGTAMPPIQKNASAKQSLGFPELPPQFDATLAKLIASGLSLPELIRVLPLIGDGANASCKEKAPAATEADTGAISDVHNLARQLADAGLERLEFKHLDDLPARLHKWTKSVQEAMKNPQLVQLGSEDNLTAFQLVRLSSMVELIDREPKNFSEYCHPHLAYQTSDALQRRARHQAKLIEQELSELQQHFRLERVQSKKQLLNLIDELGGSNLCEPDVVDADYFNARRQFMEFSVDRPSQLTLEHRKLLSQLVKVLRFRELFVNNTDYRTALGPGYRGLQTDWATLNTMLQYATDLTEHVESEQLASRLLTRWAECRNLYVENFEQLQSAAEAARKLLRIVGVGHRNTPLGKLTVHTTLLADNLHQWRKPELDLSALGEKTATDTDVLACFTGQTRTDSRTQAAVVVTESRIRKHVQSTNTQSQAVADTLNWLRQASEAATQQSLDIEAIVKRLPVNQ